MSNGLISQGLKRQQDRPDIHKKVVKVKQGTSFNDCVPVMIRDLKEHVPGLSTRQISSLVGVGQFTVLKHLKSFSEDSERSEEWTTDNNESASAAHLAALREHHDRYRDDVSYTLFDGKTADRDEWSDVPAIYATPEFRDPHRRADQSHTIKRPITLPTRPFEIAA